MTDNPNPESLLREAAPEGKPLLRQSTSAVAKAMADKSEGRLPFNELSVLFPLLTFYTVAYMGLMLADFLLREAFNLPPGMMPVYIALVGAYAGDKEIRRWTRNEAPSRKGAIFVYLWFLFFLVAFMIFAFKPEFTLPDDLLKVALQVLGIFFGSRASKYVYERRTEAAMNPAELAGRQARILEIIRTQGQVTRAEVITALGVGRSTATSLLENMVQEGLIRRAGEGRGTHYLAAEKTTNSE